MSNSGSLSSFADAASGMAIIVPPCPPLPKGENTLLVPKLELGNERTRVAGAWRQRVREVGAWEPGEAEAAACPQIQRTHNTANDASFATLKRMTFSWL